MSDKSRKELIFFISFCLGIITTLSFCIKFAIVPSTEYESYMNGSSGSIEAIFAQLRYMINGVGLKYTVLSIFYTICYYKYFNKIFEFSIITIIFSFLFTVFMLIGKCYADAGSIAFLCTSYKYFLFSIFIGIGYFCSIYMFLNCIKTMVNNYLIYCKNYNMSVVEKVFDKHVFLYSFIIFSISGLPYLLSYFPGVVNWDGLRQLDFWTGSLKWTTHHPAFSTLIMGLLFNTGKKIGNDNLGIFCYILFQYFMQSLIFAKGMELLKKFNIDFKFRFFVLLYYAMLSVWKIYSVTYIKDTVYYLSVFAFVICLIDLYMEHYNRSNMILLVLSALFVTGYRNDGIFVVLFTLISVIAKDKKLRKMFIGVLAIVLCAFIAFNYLWVPSMGIEKGSKREALSIPFQQTARYVKEYYYEVTEEEKDVINKILDFEKLPEKYNPNISDPVKGSRHTEIESKELKEYFEVWSAQLKKHPGVYIEAFLNGCYKLFYPDSLPYANCIGYYGHATDSYVVRGNIEFYFLDEFLNLRNVIRNIDMTIYKIPLINILFVPATYTWLLLIGVYICLLNKQHQKLFIYIPLGIILLINIASPVNGNLRYMLPVMACTPIVLAFTIIDKNAGNEYGSKELTM